MPRAYHYVGPKDIAERLAQAPSGAVIASAPDLLSWVRGQGGRGPITATFVIDVSGRLRVADRHSEHVACAGGGPVLAAGEMTMSLAAGVVAVDEVSNQSTGYCPEPESWAAVAEALSGLGVHGPTPRDLTVLHGGK